MNDLLIVLIPASFTGAVFGSLWADYRRRVESRRWWAEQAHREAERRRLIIDAASQAVTDRLNTARP